MIFSNAKDLHYYFEVKISLDSEESIIWAIQRVHSVHLGSFWKRGSKFVF